MVVWNTAACLITRVENVDVEVRVARKSKKSSNPPLEGIVILPKGGSQI